MKTNKIHEKYTNGFILPFANSIIILAYYLNIVEGFKYSTAFIASLFSKNISSKKSKNIGIDLYQFFKWGTIGFLWCNQIDNLIALSITLYLIWSNTFSYFYYHVWINRGPENAEHKNRRFLNFIFAIFFYICSYAYLYDIHFPQHIEWHLENQNFVDSLIISIEMAFSFDPYKYSHQSRFLQIIMTTEFLNSFIFITIIISNSIPSDDTNT